MITRHASISDYETERQNPILTVAKNVKAAKEQQARALAKDNSEKDLDPRDGFVRWTGVEDVVCTKDTYRINNRLFEFQGEKTRITMDNDKDSKLGTFIVERLYDAEKQTVDVKIYTTHELKSGPLVDNNSAVLRYDLNEISVPNFDECSKNIYAAASIAIENDNNNNNSLDRDPRPGRFKGYFYEVYTLPKADLTEMEAKISDSTVNGEMTTAENKYNFSVSRDSEGRPDLSNKDYSYSPCPSAQAVLTSSYHYSAATNVLERAYSVFDEPLMIWCWTNPEL